MATEFQDTYILFTLDPSNGPQQLAFKGSYADAIDTAQSYAEAEMYGPGVKYAIIPALTVAKVA